MQLRSILLLLVAVATAGGTAFMVNGLLTDSRQPTTEAEQAVVPQTPMTEVLVTKKEIAVGTFIKPEHLRWQPWPEEGLNGGYVVKGQATEKDFEGAVVRTRLYAGEPITKERVIHPGEQGFLAAVLEPGKRAVSVPVDATSGVAGFVFPGDRVDVLLTLKSTVATEEEGSSSSATRYFSQTLLTDVRVLGIDQAVDKEAGGAKVAKTATFEVTPKQAERIAVALQAGELSLALHSIARQEADLDALTSKNATEGGKTQAAGVATRTYTRDMDVLDMMGDPLGLPYPSGVGPKVNIIRGGETKVVRF
jgi:pilus assembly protein CpaB